MVLLLAAPWASADEFVLIGMNDIAQPGGPDQLVRIDPLTGIGTHVHTFSGSLGLNFLESLAYDADQGVMWTTNDGVLYSIDPVSFTVSEIGDTRIRDIDGLAIHPSTGGLYGVTHGGNDLIRIDKSDANVFILNGRLENGSRLEDLTFVDERLFVLTSRALVEVDPTDGSRMMKVLLHGATSLESLLWCPDRGVFLSAADRGAFKDLVTLTMSGQVDFVGPEHSGFKDVEALAWVPTSISVSTESISWGKLKQTFRE